MEYSREVRWETECCGGDGNGREWESCVMGYICSVVKCNIYIYIHITPLAL